MLLHHALNVQQVTLLTQTPASNAQVLTASDVRQLMEPSARSAILNFIWIQPIILALPVFLLAWNAVLLINALAALMDSLWRNSITNPAVSAYPVVLKLIAKLAGKLPVFVLLA